MTIEEILSLGSSDEIIEALKDKEIEIPNWTGDNGLEKEYDPSKHEVMDECLYPDIRKKDGSIEKVTRVAIGLQKLATKRMTELTCAIPIARTCKPINAKQQEIAKVFDKILKKNRIESVDNKRLVRYYSTCEIFTIWYGIEEENTLYGVKSPIKLRCRIYSPMEGDKLYPLFDDFGDMIAFSIETRKKKRSGTRVYFDTYTKDRHLQWLKDGEDWILQIDEKIELGKIPGVYVNRDLPIWEHQSTNVTEVEWTLSRNGNYIRRNMRPILAMYTRGNISVGKEEDENKAFRSVVRLDKDDKLEYVAWAQAIENLKYHVQELRSSFFRELQLPDWSYEKISQQAMSGEARKQMFIDCKLKVEDESGLLLEFFDREVNVIRAFLKKIFDTSYHNDIDAMEIEVVITPYELQEEKDKVNLLLNATGNKPLISQREAIQMAGLSSDVDLTLDLLAKEKADNEWMPNL